MKDKKNMLCTMINVHGASLKSDLNTIDVPIFSLSKNKDTKQFLWSKGGIRVVITPNKYGRATIWDKDIVLYLIGQVAATKNRTGQLSRTLRTTEHDILIATSRGAGGSSYRRLKDALRRLRNTSIETNISADGYIVEKEFSLIQEWSIVKNKKTNKTIYIEITLCEWLYKSATTRNLVTYNDEYFSITKSLERRLYEIFKKHLYKSSGWKISVKKLHHKAGGRENIYKFRNRLESYDGRITGFRFNYNSTGELIYVYPGGLRNKS